MLAAPGQSIPQCTGSTRSARAFYRLLDDEELTDTLILETHRAGVLRRAAAGGVEVLLAIQDTTTLNFDTRKTLEGLGAIGANNTEHPVSGLLVHSTLLTAADRDEVYGLLGANIYARDPDKRKTQAPGTRNREPIEAKESIRWLESFELARQAQQILAERTAAAVRIVSVGDREADIYELLLEAQEHRSEGLGLLVRSQYNRGLVECLLPAANNGASRRGPTADDRSGRAMDRPARRPPRAQRRRPPRPRSNLARPNQTRRHHRSLADVPP